MQKIDQIFIDLAGQYLLDDLHALSVGYAKSVYKRTLFPDARKHFCDFGTAAVHQYHPYANQGQKNDIAHHGFFQFSADHRISAVFDDDDFIGIFLNIRQRLDQNAGALRVCQFHFVLLRYGNLH